MEKLLSDKIRRSNLLKKTMPVSLALVLTFNTTLGAVLVQHYFYKNQMRELVVNKDKLTLELENTPEKQAERIQAILFPEGGIVLPVKWGDVGAKLVDTGVIDKERFLGLFKAGPLSGVPKEYEDALMGVSSDNIVLTPDNSRFVLNTLWALGLAQQSDVLDEMQKDYDQLNRLASTGGWSLGKNSAMSYYSNHEILNLSEKQDNLVSEIAANIYRPCCGNHTAFADCNHGMAMLGLVELMASQGYTEDEIYDTALAVNTVWFPDTYMTVAKYMEEKRQLSWDEVDAKEVLGKDFSSAQGYRKVLAQVNPLPSKGSGGGCSV